MGTSLLPMLLGSSQASIVSVLMKLLGLGDKSVLGLLGSLAPIVMGVVGKQAKSAGGFDPGVLTNLLGSQGSSLNALLPNELKGVMGLADLGKVASDAVSGAARSATQAAQQAAAPASNPLGWLLPLLALGALGALAYMFMGGKKEEAIKPVKNAPAVGAETAPPVKNVPDIASALPELPALELPGGMSLDDLRKKLTGSFEGIQETLGTITDVDTAKGAVGKLEEAAKAYAEFGLDKLPSAAATTALGPFVKPYFQTIGGLLEKLYAIPGVKEVIEPVLGPMVSGVAKLVGG
jgi:hypothetical protein